MSIHYKFKTSLAYDTLAFDGLHISVADLKAAIFQQKRIGKTSDFDLEITNAQTKEVYSDNHTLVPKNTSLLVARVPLAQKPKKTWDGSNSTAPILPGTRVVDGASALKSSTDLSRMEGSEEDKILAMMSQSTQDYDPSNYQNFRGSHQRGEVPPHYRCHKCHETGHWIQDCPQGNAAEPLDIKRSTGIPRSFMVPVEGPTAPGAMITPTGNFAVPHVDLEAYNASDTGVEQPSVPSEPVRKDIPEDLLCSLCKDLLTDAVMIPCCGNSFCDECIRGALLESEDHECPDCRDKDISPSTLIPNRFLRNSVATFRNQTGYIPKPRPPPKVALPVEKSPKVATTKPVAEAESTTKESNTEESRKADSAVEKSKDDIYEDSDEDDNITVTVPPRQTPAVHHQHIQSHSSNGSKPSSVHPPSHYPSHQQGDNYGRPHPTQNIPHGPNSRGLNLKPAGFDSTSSSQISVSLQNDRVSSGNERKIHPRGPHSRHRDPPLQRPDYVDPSAHYMPPRGPPAHQPPYNAYGQVAPTGAPQFGPPTPYAAPYQPVVPGVPTQMPPLQQPKIIEDPLEAFERMIREKEELARLREKRSRTRSRSRSRSRSRPRSISRSRSRFTRSRSRSRIRSFSRSRSRPTSVRSPMRRLPPRRGSFSRSPLLRRGGRPPSVRRSREKSFSRSRSRSRSRSMPHKDGPRRRSPPRYHSPLHGQRTSPRPRFNSDIPPNQRGPGESRTLRSPPPHPQGPPLLDPHHRFGPPSAITPANLIQVPVGDSGMRFSPPFEDAPPGTQPPPPGEHSPIGRRDDLIPPGIGDREKDRSISPARDQRPFRDHRPPLRDNRDGPTGYLDKRDGPSGGREDFRDFPSNVRDEPPPGFRGEFRDAPPPGMRDNRPPTFRDGPPNFTPVHPHDFRENQANNFRENQPNNFRENHLNNFRDGPPPVGYRDTAQYRDGPPPNFRENVPSQGHYRDRFPPPGYRDGPPPGFRDAPPSFREGPERSRDGGPPFRDNVRDGPFRERPGHGREGPFRDNHPHSRDNHPHSRDNHPHGRDNHPYNRDGLHGRDRFHDRENHPRPHHDRGPRDRHRDRESRDFRDSDRKEKDYDKTRDDRPRDDKSRDHNERDKEHGAHHSPERRHRSISPRRELREDRSRHRRTEQSRDKPKESPDSRRDLKNPDKMRSEDEKNKEKDRKLRDKKKKKKEKEKDTEKRKKKEKRDKKEKHEISKVDEQRETGNQDLNDSGAEPQETLDVGNKVDAVDAEAGICNDFEEGDVDKNTNNSFTKDEEMNNDEVDDEKETSFDGIELQADDLDLKPDTIETHKDKVKGEVLAPLPELSKWEIDEDQVSGNEKKELGEIDSPDKSGKVTSEVLKRAENAIFAKAINAIRPIEIKRISSDRAKLYSGESEDVQLSEKEEKGVDNIQITVPVNTDQRSVEINDVRKVEEKPPTKLSVKERLGKKIDEPQRRPRELHSTVERIRSRSRSPHGRRIERDPHRRVTVDSSRDRNKRYVTKVGVSENRGLPNEYRISSRNERPYEEHPHHRSKDGQKPRSPLREERAREEKKRDRNTPASSSPERKIRRKEKKHNKKDKDDHPSKLIENADTKLMKSNVDSDIVMESWKPGEGERKKSTLDESNFEPDYDETVVESENEGKGSQKDTQSKHSEENGPNQTIELNLTNVRMKEKSESSSSTEDSSSSSTSSDSKKKKRKKRKNKKRKAKQPSDSGSDSESSSDEPKKKKRKHKHKKKASKKKKRIKHKNR